jgi:hypothetical protein
MQPIFITHERRNENMAKFVFNLTSNLVEDANTYQRIVEFPEYWQSWLGDSQASHIQSRLDAYASICSVSGILWKQQAGEWVRSAYTPSVTAKRA